MIQKLVCFKIISIFVCIGTLCSAAEFELLSISPTEEDSVYSLIGPGTFREPPQTDIKLSGPIAAGDAQSLEMLLTNAQTFRGSTRLLLDSPGGSFQEALLLANLVRDRGLLTYVGEEEQCLSACALVFMSGSYIEGDDSRFTHRKMHHKAIVGFHAPFTFSRSQEVSEEVRALLLADAERLSMEAGSALVRMSVDGRLPSHLVEDLMLVEQDEFLFVDTVDRAGIWGILIDNAIPMNSLDHVSMEEYCTNEYAWQRAIRFENRKPNSDVVLLALNGGAELMTDMMDYTCNVRLTGSSRFDGPVAVNRITGSWIYVWETLPAETRLIDLGPNEVFGAKGAKGNLQNAQTEFSVKQVDYNAIKRVTGNCKGDFAWTAGWTGPNIRSDDGQVLPITKFEDADRSYAGLNWCGGGLGPFGINCSHGTGRYELRFSELNTRDVSPEGMITVQVDGANFQLPGEHRDLYGHLMFYSIIEPDHPIVEALKRGSNFSFLAGGVPLELHLSGSRRAIEAMELACR